MRPFDFEQIFRQAPTAFSIVDLEGRQIDGSDHYWELFGIDPTTVDPDVPVVTRLTDVHDAEITREYFAKLRSGDIDEISVEKRYRRTNGETFWGRLRSSPILDTDGEVVAIAGVITDISAEREARDALVASEVERSKADHRVVAEAIRSFIGSVEHEVRSPLHSILGLTELLAAGDTLTAAQRHALHDEALRLGSIIEEVSDFSKAELAATDAPPARRRLDERWSAALETAASKHRRLAQQQTDTGGAPRHVLVVDDGEVNRLLAVSQLQRLGYETTTASNGLEAVAMAETTRFDVILMDWHMPVLDGVDATRRIRRTEAAGSRVPIIAITASLVEGVRTVCLDAGMDDVLVKPVTLAQLDAALHRQLPDPVHSSPLRPPAGPVDDSTNSRSSIDPRALAELERETGDRSVVGIIIDTYLDELDQRLSTIGSTADVVRSGESAAVGELVRSSHTLKSTAALVGATRLSHLCEQLQILAGDRPGPEAVALASAVIAEARRTAIDLQAVRARL